MAMIGATGLVGRQLWPLLAKRGELLVLGRHKSGAVREKLGEMAEWPGLLCGEPVDVAISTLGSTRKAAGSWDAFVAVDRDALLAFARAARNAGARQFITVSSVGADPGSKSAYLRLKGDVERALAKIGFNRLDIVRPGLLLGKRDGPPRIFEQLAARLSPLLNPLLRGPLDRYAAIDSACVASAMAALVGAQPSGHFVHENDAIRSPV